MEKKEYDRVQGNPNIKLKLSQEQCEFIRRALDGHNILVDACIGSGKTTAIQYLCNEISSDKQVLYLTYNRLLKVDAQSKIRKRNVKVTNYHGFAYGVLSQMGKLAGVSDSIKQFLRESPPICKYDVLIIDEYQDIEQEFAQLLEYIRSFNPLMQIIAVGDMAQKIYDKTTLQVPEFIDRFLGKYIRLSFTRCFRLNADLALRLGRIWGKPIIGVNKDCDVQEMTLSEVVGFLSAQRPGDILCLGARTGNMADILNILEETIPEKFNKKTVYASIRDSDSGGKVSPSEETAIFTTYDSSKGLERKICVIFDFTESYWERRAATPRQKYAILRNIFCVAASRGKTRIVFVNNGEAMLSDQTLGTPFEENQGFKTVAISEMFDFKYREDVEACFSELDIRKLHQADTSVIPVKMTDALIDLSPCTGIYQEAVFFGDYQIDLAIESYFTLRGKMVDYPADIRQASLEEKILYLTSLETKQSRYCKQVVVPWITEEQKKQIIERLAVQFETCEMVQAVCSLNFMSNEGEKLFSARGLADVVKEDAVWELKFVEQLTQEHFLQCACYMAALGLKKGVLWNTRDNSQHAIRIPNQKRFLDRIAQTITKGQLTSRDSHRDDCIAVIDTETNWDDRVMSIGLVIARQRSYDVVEKRYFILEPECQRGGMYAGVLYRQGQSYMKCSREEAIRQVRRCLEAYGIRSVLAYNAPFDRNHLPELADCEWLDIMRIAAYRQHNTMLPANGQYCSTGRLKKDYGVQPMLRMLTGDAQYEESHHALEDALDELRIVKLLGQDVALYKSHAALPAKTATETANRCIKSEAGHSEMFIAVPEASQSSIEAQPEPQLDRAKEKMAGYSVAEAALLRVPRTAERRETFIAVPEAFQSPIEVQPEPHLDRAKEKMAGYSVAEAAALLRISKEKVYRLIRKGTIPAEKTDRRYRISRQGLERYRKRRRLLRGLGLTACGLLLLTILFFLG